MPLVTGRINVLVFERMVNVDRDIHAGQLASPEEIPVLLNLEIFIPTNRLQDVSIGHKAIANVMAPSNLNRVASANHGWIRSRVPLLRSIRGRSSLLLSAASRSMSLFRFSLSTSSGNRVRAVTRVIVIRENNNRRVARAEQAIATS